MDRRLTLVLWVLVGAAVGYSAVGIGGAVVCLLVFGVLSVLWLGVRPEDDRRPAHGALVCLFVVAWFVFFIDVGAHGGFE